ncbi:MAG TPA: DUF664 domain-containing protein [Mycobacteriales bacterium]|nr:DUF664 domain-containing protein [Mycobacteriales bacterium]
MTSTDFPWEPPLAGDETAHLLGALDRLRTTFRWKADGLDDGGLRVSVGASTLTIGGLLKHLAFVEAYTARLKRAGESPGPPWESIDWDAEPGWDFSSAAEDSATDLYALYDDAVASARDVYAEAIAGGGLDQPVHVNDNGRHASLRRLLFDLVEEYGRHTGHADLIRESIDGRVGEDPPAGWTAESGSYRI